MPEQPEQSDLPLSGRSFDYQEGYCSKQRNGEYRVSYHPATHHMLAGELLALEWLTARLGRHPELPAEDRERLERLSVFDCALIGRNMPGYPPDDRDRECSHLVGPQIIVGIYRSEARRLASFFHEVGHTFPDRIDRTQPDATWKVQQERHAWEDGFALAARAGVVFRPAVHRWAEACIETYREYK